MAVDLNDERLKNVENEKNNAIQETTNTYNEMINNSDKIYQQQVQTSKDFANKQTEIQKAQTDFTIEKINQEKEKAEKDYIKEQKASYVDYQKQTNKYGANAEAMASQGLTNSGYSESSNVSMYNTYQKRYATAREAYNNAVLNYNNSIKEAQLANNSKLAEIAYNALQQQLSLSLEGFQYKNSLIQTKLSAVNEQVDRYDNKYQNVLHQINTENALEEQIRQYNESLAEQRRQHDESLQEQKRQYNETMAWNQKQAQQEQANWEKEYALSVSNAKNSSSSKSSSGGSGTAQLTDSNKEDDSSYGEGYNGIKKAVELASKNKWTSKGIESYLTKQYANGKITEAGLKKLIDDYNLNKE